MPNPDDPLATETIEHRRRIEAADARFRATLSQALRRGEETLQGCVGRHERLRNFYQPPLRALLASHCVIPDMSIDCPGHIPAIDLVGETGQPYRNMGRRLCF